MIPHYEKFSCFDALAATCRTAVDRLMGYAGEGYPAVTKHSLTDGY